MTELRLLLAQGDWTIAVGEFDPLMAEVAEFIEKARPAGGKLLVVLRSSVDEFFGAEARAVLLAGLRSVDAVLVAEDEEWRSLAMDGRVPVIEEDNGSRKRSEFQALVVGRQRASRAAPSGNGGGSPEGLAPQ